MRGHDQTPTDAAQIRRRIAAWPASVQATHMDGILAKSEETNHGRWWHRCAPLSQPEGSC
jgi:hypothetical protein